MKPESAAVSVKEDMMRLDDDLKAALDRVGWNEDAVSLARQAQDYRENPPPVLTPDEVIAAVMDANDMEHQYWRDALNHNYHTLFKSKRTGKSEFFAIPQHALLTLERSGLVEMWNDHARKAIEKLHGEYRSPDLHALLEQKRAAQRITQ